MKPTRRRTLGIDHDKVGYIAKYGSFTSGLLQRHLPPKSPTPPPKKRRPKPWCTQYIQDLKEHLVAEKQIAAASSDEVVIAAIRVDPQILEEHLAIC